jgi:hypothetical protein
VLNNAPPKIDPKGIKTVEADVLAPAKTAVNTSGAPLASAKKVTPANVGEISIFNQVLLNRVMTFSTAGVNECSVSAFNAK